MKLWLRGPWLFKGGRGDTVLGGKDTASSEESGCQSLGPVIAWEVESRNIGAVKMWRLILAEV